MATKPRETCAEPGCITILGHLNTHKTLCREHSGENDLRRAEGLSLLIYAMEQGSGEWADDAVARFMEEG
jgi:hypothetical protein